MNLLKAFLDAVTAHEKTDATRAPMISNAAVDAAKARALEDTAQVVVTPGAGGALNIFLDIAAVRFNDSSAISQGGTALHFARDGSAPDIRLELSIGSGVVGRLAPGESYRGTFSSFAVKRLSPRRVMNRTGVHRARIVVERGAAWSESAGTRPVFEPVPLMPQDFLAGQTGTVADGMPLALTGAQELLVIVPGGFRTVRFFFDNQAIDGTLLNLVILPYIVTRYSDGPNVGLNVGTFPVPSRLISLTAPAGGWDFGSFDFDTSAWNASDALLLRQISNSGTSVKLHWWAYGVE